MKNKKRKAHKDLLTVDLTDYADKNIVSVCRPGNDVSSIYGPIYKKELIVDTFSEMRQAVSSYSSEILKASRSVSELALCNHNVVSSIVSQSGEMRQAIASYSSEMLNASNCISELALHNHNVVSSIASQAFGITKSISELVAKESLGFQSMTVLGSEMREAMNRTVSLFHDSMRESMLSTKILNDAVFAIPTTLITKKIDENSRVSLLVDDHRSCVSNNEFQITATTTEQKDYGLLALQEIQKTHLVVASIDNKFNGIDQKFVEFDEKLSKLFEKCTIQGGKVVRVQSVKYQDKVYRLIINGEVVPIPVDSDRHCLCQAIFSNKKELWEPTELLEIMEVFGVDMINLRRKHIEEWDTKISGTVRHLNDNISRYTDFDKLLKYSKRIIMINPHYLGLIS